MKITCNVYLSNSVDHLHTIETSTLIGCHTFDFEIEQQIDDNYIVFDDDDMNRKVSEFLRVDVTSVDGSARSPDHIDMLYESDSGQCYLLISAVL